MPPGLGPVHLLVIAVVALVVLGPERLPQVARQAGKAMGEFRRWTQVAEDEARSLLAFDAEREPDALPSSPADERLSETTNRPTTPSWVVSNWQS